MVHTERFIPNVYYHFIMKALRSPLEMGYQDNCVLLVWLLVWGWCPGILLLGSTQPLQHEEYLGLSCAFWHPQGPWLSHVACLFAQATLELSALQEILRQTTIYNVLYKRQCSICIDYENLDSRVGLYKFLKSRTSQAHPTVGFIWQSCAPLVCNSSSGLWHNGGCNADPTCSRRRLWTPSHVACVSRMMKLHITLWLFAYSVLVLVMARNQSAGGHGQHH